MNRADNVLFRVKGDKVSAAPSRIKRLPLIEKTEALRRLQLLGTVVAGFARSEAPAAAPAPAAGGAGRARSPSPPRAAAPAAAPAPASSSSIPKIPASTEFINDRGRYYLGDRYYSSPAELRAAVKRVLFDDWDDRDYRADPKEPSIYGYPVDRFQPEFKKQFGSDYYGGALGDFIHKVERWIKEHTETSPIGNKYIRVDVYKRLRDANP